MNSPENKGYWTEQIGVFQREIRELEAYLKDSQNVISLDGEDASEKMADVEIDLTQTKTALKHAKFELKRIEQQEEIAALLPQIEKARKQAAQQLRQSDAEEAKAFKEIQERLEARVQELRRDPVLDEDEE